jgi:hypothetical protein
MDSQTKSSQVAETVAALKDIPTKDMLFEMLTRDTYTVTFDKLDGTERKMLCTLMPWFLSRAIGNVNDKTISYNPEDKNLTVWSMESAAWRSFRYDRVKKVELAPTSSALNTME